MTGDWPAAVHVTNGDATDVPGTGLAGQVLYWRDVLHEGPVPAVGPDELRELRADFLSQGDPVVRAEVAADLAVRDAALAAGREGDYVLWFEADLYDQLQIIQILDRLAGLEVPAERITLICIGEYPGIGRFGGLGELTAEQLRELPDRGVAVRLTPVALQLATRAWAAFRAPSPDGFPNVVATRSGELRFLGEAFERLAREYPAVRDGLSLTERRVLAAVSALSAPGGEAVADGAAASGGASAPGGADMAGGGAEAGAVFVRAAWREARRFLGDTWCFAAMDRLATGPDPLLLTEPAGPVDRSTTVRLTDAGARVLAGDARYVSGDRWVGGVHLPGAPWRWDDGTETLVRVG